MSNRTPHGVLFALLALLIGCIIDAFAARVRNFSNELLQVVPYANACVLRDYADWSCICQNLP